MGLFHFEATTLPTRQNRTARRLASGSADNEQAARRSLASELRAAIPAGAGAALVANQAESVFTDFPEYGITARVWESVTSVSTGSTGAQTAVVTPTTPSAVSRIINDGGLGSLCAVPPKFAHTRSASVLVYPINSDAARVLATHLRARNYVVRGPSGHDLQGQCLAVHGRREG